VERYLERDDRLAIPLGSIEQHAYLSLGTDRILSERVAVEAAEPLGVLVLPSQPYGVTPYFAAYPGSPSLREETYAALLRDLLDSLSGQGFRRFLFVNGHGGNAVARPAVEEWGNERTDCRVRWHDWWAGERVRAIVDELDPGAAHASWHENYPWTRLPDVELPAERKELVQLTSREPHAVREQLGDGMYGGFYQRPDDDVLRVWAAGVEETRALLGDGWG
jgi:creatinine amidohydrolase